LPAQTHPHPLSLGGTPDVTARVTLDHLPPEQADADALEEAPAMA
jgi:hypothetical protein